MYIFHGIFSLRVITFFLPLSALMTNSLKIHIFYSADRARIANFLIVNKGYLHLAQIPTGHPGKVDLFHGHWVGLRNTFIRIESVSES